MDADVLHNRALQLISEHFDEDNTDDGYKIMGMAL